MPYFKMTVLDIIHIKRIDLTYCGAGSHWLIAVQKFLQLYSSDLK